MLNNTIGITSNLVDSERSEYYSRGFKLTNFTFDGIPTSVGDTWNFMNAASRIQIRQYMIASRQCINMPTAKGSPEPLSVSYGSWDKQRYIADVSVPLNTARSVRGYVYGVLDEDITEDTTVSLEYHYQDVDTRVPIWNGNLAFYSNGSLIHYQCNLNSSVDWIYYYTTARKVYADLLSAPSYCSVVSINLCFSSPTPVNTT